MFCVYLHFFDMKTNKNEIKKMGQPGFEPTNYISGAILTNHTTTVESTTTDLIAIVPRRLFPYLLETYRLHTIHHEKLYIQC